MTMNESKSLKSVLNFNDEVSNINTNLSKVVSSRNLKINEWIQMQHNVSLRQISPYLNEIQLQHQETINLNETQKCSAFNKIFQSLKEDEEIFQISKQSVDNYLYNSQNLSHSSQNLNCSNEVSIYNKNITTNQQKEKFQYDLELKKLVSSMNSSFVAKEIKKVIRFKFGFRQILDDEIYCLKKQLKYLEAQQKLISMIPEVYDKEALHLGRVSVENLARQVLINCRESCKSQDLSKEIKNEQKIEDKSKDPYKFLDYNFDDEDHIFNAKQQQRQNEEVILYDYHDDGIISNKKTSKNKCLTRESQRFCLYCSPIECNRKTSTFLNITDEEEGDTNESFNDLSNDGNISNLKNIKKACNSISRRMSNMKIDNIGDPHLFNESDNISFDSNDFDDDNIKNIVLNSAIDNTLDASDIYNNQKKFDFVPD